MLCWDTSAWNIPSPWWADKISRWRNTACSDASEELRQQQPQQKTSAGEWFHRRGWRWHWLYPVAGGSHSASCYAKQYYTTQKPFLLLHPYTIFLTIIPQEAPDPCNQPFRVNIWCNHPPALSCAHKHTFLGARMTRSTSLVRLQDSDGIYAVMERFAYVKTEFILEKHMKHNKSSADTVVPCKNVTKNMFIFSALFLMVANF